MLGRAIDNRAGIERAFRQAAWRRDTGNDITRQDFGELEDLVTTAALGPTQREFDVFAGQGLVTTGTQELHGNFASFTRFSTVKPKCFKSTPTGAEAP